jgi:Zn-finger nucleic acid-binding protein
MKCPNDGAVLTMSERSGVEIDYCPECRGVWLDRGELDKILDRMAAEAPAAPPPAAPQQDYRQQDYRQQGYRQQGYQDSPGYSSGGYGGGKYQGGRRPKKKEHWLSELFD